MGRSWMIRLSFRRPPLSANQRLDWRAKARLTREVRRDAGWLIRAAGVPACERVQVRLVWRVADRRRRDPSNTMPTQKAVVDGLVDAGVVPDDTPQYVVEQMPVIELVGKGECGVFLQLDAAF